MRSTQNGWPVAPATTKIRLPNGDTADVRKGSVATIFQWLVREIDAYAEKGVTISGYRTPAQNSASGGIATSNHISGTAVDYNGFKHPYEATRKPWVSGWSATATKRVNLILSVLGGRIRWGLYFQVGWRDGMHFEVAPGVTSAQLDALARKLKGGTVRVTASALNARTKPSTQAPKVRSGGKVIVRAKGFRITYVDVVVREGRVWLKTRYGNYYAAEFTSF